MATAGQLEPGNRRVSSSSSSSSSHLTATTNTTSTNAISHLRARSLPQQDEDDEEVEWEEEVAESPESDPEGCIVLGREAGSLRVVVPRAPARTKPPPRMDPGKKTSESEFFTEYGELNRYQVSEVIGKGSYGVVAAAIDTQTGERVAIKKINGIFDHVSDATRILREIKLLRLLRHPDIVEIKHIMVPPSRREFRDIYVVFELMESDLHQWQRVMGSGGVLERREGPRLRLPGHLRRRLPAGAQIPVARRPLPHPQPRHRRHPGPLQIRYVHYVILLCQPRSRLCGHVFPSRHDELPFDGGGDDADDVVA